MTKPLSTTSANQNPLNFTSLRRKDPELILDQQELEDGNIKAQVNKIISVGKIKYNEGT